MNSAMKWKHKLSNIAKQIQVSRYVSDERQWTFVFGKYINDLKDDMWYKVNYDHRAVNGQHICNLFAENEISIKSHFNDQKNYGRSFDMENGAFKVEKIERNNVEEMHKKQYISYGKKIATKEIIKDGLMCCPGDFYMPLDVTHAFGGNQCLLSFILRKDGNFEEQWKEMIRLKKNQDNCLFINDNWKNYLKTTKTWITIARIHQNLMIDRRYCNGYDMDYVNEKDRLQALTIMAGHYYTFWSFTYEQDPDAIKYFIKKYELQPFNMDHKRINGLIQ